MRNAEVSLVQQVSTPYTLIGYNHSLIFVAIYVYNFNGFLHTSLAISFTLVECCAMHCSKRKCTRKTYNAVVHVYTLPSQQIENSPIDMTRRARSFHQ